MRMITTAGAHACGKTAVILKTAEMLMKEGIRTGVMKLDCISSGDDQLYRACGIPNIKYISGNICPDHYFADSVPEKEYQECCNKAMALAKTLVAEEAL